ncbi:nuclear transport factor 2 family protein [Myxococcota bacterium]|nr:nuclear transport factor 2 family protein [Myxococcota bacterium]MCZ7619775.1 nuclear transport factor 2 family protein [Myxococcota bacterium]
MDLHALEAIKRLKYKYLRCLDQKRWEELAECFTEDARSSYGGGRYEFLGREAILEFLRRAMGAPSFLSSHRVHHPEIDFTGPATATGTWALEDTVIETRAGITIRGAAFYTDEYVKQGDAWKIRFTGYKRTYEEIESRRERPGLRLTASWFETDGRSEL